MKNPVCYMLTPGCSTWVARYRAWDPVITIEQLPPQEFVSGHGEPLATGQSGVQHRCMRETQEDLQYQTVRQVRNACHPDILKQWHVTMGFKEVAVLVIQLKYSIWVCNNREMMDGILFQPHLIAIFKKIQLLIIKYQADTVSGKYTTLSSMH